jgi:uncharacterized integral membrane protein
MFGDDDVHTGDADGRKLSAGVVALLLGLVALGAFMVQNPDRVRVEFLFWDLELALWFLVLASAVLGALVWSGIGLVRRRRRR